MANPLIIVRTDQFRIISYGNGTAYSFQSVPHALEIFLQGDDATRFRSEWDGLEAANPDASLNAVLSRLWFDYEDVSQETERRYSNGTIITTED